MKIFGYKQSDFTAKDGTPVTGYNVYLGQPIAPNLGEGMSAERQYLSTAKVAKLGVDLADLVGKDVDVFYNRYGKIETIIPTETK